MLDELRILHNDSVYPVDSGASVRVINIARVCRELFDKTTLFAIDSDHAYTGKIKDVDVVQYRKIHGRLDRHIYNYRMLFSKNFILNGYDSAFQNVEKNTLFQIEGPFNYPLLKKRGVDRFVLDQHNVYWEIHDFPEYNIKNKIYYRLTHEREKRNEIDAIKKASHVLVCSERDKTKILENVPVASDKITAIPNGVDFYSFDSYVKMNDKVKNDSDVIKVLFVGTYVYAPNVEALYSICKEIAPKFDMKVQFIIVGKNPPDIKKPENVSFTGYVEDLKKVIMECDICIAPLKYGSGTRLKVLEYMAMGKPVISTSKGAEGIDYANGKNIIIEDNIEKYADRITELIDDHRTRRTIGAGASDIIQKRYDWKAYKNDLYEIYKKALEH